jgi:hypothetical protein
MSVLDIIIDHFQFNCRDCILPLCKFDDAHSDAVVDISVVEALRQQAAVKCVRKKNGQSCSFTEDLKVWGGSDCVPPNLCPKHRLFVVNLSPPS